jgi:hypothetical protein
MIRKVIFLFITLLSIFIIFSVVYLEANYSLEVIFDEVKQNYDLSNSKIQFGDSNSQKISDACKGKSSCKPSFNKSKQIVYYYNGIKYGVINIFSEIDIKDPILIRHLHRKSDSKNSVLPDLGMGAKEYSQVWFWELGGGCATNKRVFIEAENGIRGKVHDYVYCGGTP